MKLIMQSIGLLTIMLLAIIVYMFATDDLNFTHEPFVSPLSTTIPAPTPTTPAPTASPTPTPTPAGKWVGKASWYGENGCLGCSATLTMANGQRLDDTKMTVAFNRAPLGSQLQITNTTTNLTTTATITDTGGFERHGKIIDLVPAVRDAIGCGSVCDVEITVRAK